MRTRLISCMAAAGMITTNPAWSAIDGVEAARSLAGAALSWENIQGGPYWVSGPSPLPSAHRKWHVVELKGRQGVAIHVPAHAMLRIVADEHAPLEPPVVARSDGTGLAVEQAPIPASDGRSWLVRNDASHPVLVHVHRAALSDTPQAVALFLARVDTPSGAGMYRHALPLEGERASLRRSDEALARSFVRMAAGKEYTLVVRGPDRILLEYLPDARFAGSGAILSMEAALDGTPARLVQQVVMPETATPVQIDGAWQPAGKLVHAALDIPPGEHRLHLRASHAALLNAAAEGMSDFLLPQFNLPEEWGGAESDTTLEALEQNSIAAGAASEWRGSGVLAGRRLQREASLRTGYPKLQRTADTLEGMFTGYRDLLPDGPAALQARSVIVQQPYAPEGSANHFVAGPEAAFALVPVALFHQVHTRTITFTLPDVGYPLRIRALVPADVPPSRLEVEYDNGGRTALLTGVPALSDDTLRPGALVGVGRQQDSWPSGLGGDAGRAGALAVQVRAASTEWQVPPGVRRVRLRAVEGNVPVALQWTENREYMPDDQFLAQLAERGPGHAFGPLMLAGLKPLERMLAASYARFTANVEPPAPAVHADAAQARQAVKSAQNETDPVMAVRLWQQGMQTREDAVRAQALRGLAWAMMAAGERFSAERLLRSYWISNNATLADAAGEELDALYTREDDRAAQLLFAAARASRDKSSYARLSRALAADGDDDHALLAGLAGVDKDIPVMLQSALRTRRWLTFDALLKQVESTGTRAFWQAQRALSLGRVDEAAQHFAEGNAHEWNKALEAGRAIASSLQEGNERPAAVKSWLQWQVAHPGARTWADLPDAVVRHAGGISLRNVALDLRSSWLRATPERPLAVRIVGPARIRIEARPLHENGDSLLTGWLRVRGEDQLWVQAFHQNQVAAGLESDRGEVLPGIAVVREINLPSGLHELSIDAGPVAIAARVQVERPVLQLPVLPAPVAAHFAPLAAHAGRVEHAPACGLRRGCVVVADGGLKAYTVAYEPTWWNGLPAPEQERDPVADRLASNDIDGALREASEPEERMRLLLWLAENRPGERARALAQAAEIAKAHPVPEIQTKWHQINAGSGWSPIHLVDRSAGLRRIVVEGAEPESPGARIRAALLPALQAGEVRIGAGARATLVSDSPSAGSLVVEVRHDEMPGNASLPMQFVVERNGIALHTLRLEKANEMTKIPVAVPAGRQQVSVALKQAYANQFLRVRFTGDRQPLPAVTRDWHIATAAQAVEATVGGPAWIRIDRLDKDGVRSEERLVTGKVEQLVLRPQPDHTESLYRIYQMRINPDAVPGAMPRPDKILLSPVPEAPDEWKAEPEAAPKTVKFVDAESLEGQRDATVSLRGAFVHRRDVEPGRAPGDPLPERFVETGISWRRQSEDQSAARFADLFVRSREYGQPVAGFRLRGEQQFPWSAAFPWPLTFGAALSGFAQNTDDKLGTSLTFEASVSQTQRFNGTLSHAPALEFFARSMNLDSVRDRREVDTDVFSPYRKEQRRGLTLSDVVSWRPWRDTHLAAGISATTNPDFSFRKVDNHQASLQWRQLVGPVVLEFGGRVAKYWADADRPSTVTRRELRLGASGDWWVNAGNRVEVRAELRRDTTTSATWGGVEMRWHWGPGRGLRDFHKGELDFSALRGWSIPRANNRIEEEK